MQDSKASHPISRREMLRRAAAAGIAVPSLAALLAACGGDDPGTTSRTTGDSQPNLARPDDPVTLPLADDNLAIADGLDPEQGPLRIFGFNDYIWKKVRASFTERYGANIEYTAFDTADEMVSMVRSGGANFDLIVTVSPLNVGKLAYGKLIQPLNKGYIPNFANVWLGLQSPYFDVGSLYTVPYTVYTTGLAYRNDLVPDAAIAGSANPYEILWDTDYARQAHLMDFSRDVLATPLLRMGEDINTTDAALLAQAREMLLEGVATMDWKFDHVDYNELADFTIHQTWSGLVVYYQYYLPKDLPISAFSYVWPPRTSDTAGILNYDLFAIPKGAASPVLAHTMIDFLLDPQNALTNYSYEGYQPPITQFDNEKVVADGLVPKNLENALIAEEDVDSGVQVLELPETATLEYQQIYQEVTGRSAEPAM